LLHDDRRVMIDLRDLSDDDGLSCYYTSSCLETCHTTLDMLGETLSLDNVVSENENHTDR
jgi:hypothetical protein